MLGTLQNVCGGGAVMRVHSHRENFLIYPDIETRQELFRMLTCDDDIYLQDGKYGTWVNYEEWPDDRRVRFERGDNASDSVIDRKHLHLSILAR